MLFIGILRQAQFHKLDLFKLMLTENSPCITAVTAGLAAKARRIGGVIFWQLPGVENLTGVIVCNGDLGGRDQRKTAVVLYVKKVLFKFWKLSGAEEGGTIHQKRRLRLGISVLNGVNIEHKIDKRAAQSRSRTVQNGETRTGDRCGAFEIEDAEGKRKINMIFRLESHFTRLAPTSDFLVSRFVQANGNVVRRNIRQSGKQLAHLGVSF